MRIQLPGIELKSQLNLGILANMNFLFFSIIATKLQVIAIGFIKKCYRRNKTFNVYFLTFKYYEYTFVKKTFDVWHFHWFTVPDQYSYDKGSSEPSIESD